MPGLAPGTEVAAYYDVATAFGLTIDVVGPVSGYEALLAEIADPADLGTLVGECSRYLWPDRYDLRRIPRRDPTPVYPLSLIWRDDNTHPRAHHAPQPPRRPTNHCRGRDLDTGIELVRSVILVGPGSGGGPRSQLTRR
jgi:hypothetical protein